MNLIKFPVGTTNIFPIANSKAGGQLLTEFNLRSRESVGTPQSIKYMTGPSYTHSTSDFWVSRQTDSLGTVISNQILQISEGTALVNGHFIESLAPITIDMAAENAFLKKQGLGKELTGDLVVGLRTMYSTEQTTSGSLLVENEEDMYAGIQVVILPKNEFKLPVDVPENPNAVTAHLKLASFKYRNNAITNIENDENKVQMITADRIGDIGGYLSNTYVSKKDLNANHHYVFGGKQRNWCEADESLAIWDHHPQLADLPSGTKATRESYFRYNNRTGKTELVIAHKQPDGMVSTDGKEQYYPDNYLPLPTANYVNGQGGTVTRTYTNNIKAIARKIDRLYLLPSGGMKLYIDSLTDKTEQLPKISRDTGWKPGDYVVVGQDYVYGEDGGSEGSPISTMYVVIPGKIKALKYTTEIVHKTDTLKTGVDWDTFIKEVISSVDWNTHIKAAIIASGDVHSVDWSRAIKEVLSGKDGILQQSYWQKIIEDAIRKHREDEINWTEVISQAWDSAKDRYVANITDAIADAQASYEAAQGDVEQWQNAIDNKQSEITENQAAIQTNETSLNTVNTNIENAIIAQGRMETVMNELANLENAAARLKDWYKSHSSGEPSKSDREELLPETVTQIDWDSSLNNKTYISIFAGIKRDNCTDKNLTDCYKSYKTEQNKQAQLVFDWKKPGGWEEMWQQLRTQASQLQNEKTKLAEEKRSLERSKTKAENVMEAALGELTTLDVNKRIFEEVYEKGSEDIENSESEGGTSTFPIQALIDKIRASIESDVDYVDWTALINREISEGIAYTSGVPWNDMIADAVETSRDINNINWPEVFIEGINAQIDASGKKLEDYLTDDVPADLRQGGGICLGIYDADPSFNRYDYKSETGIYQLIGIDPDDTSVEEYPRGRSRITDMWGNIYGPDYYIVRVTDDDNNRVTHYYYEVLETTSYEYCDPPVMITGATPLAEQNMVGGFVNVPEDSRGAGYVYRNDEGYLQLIDYDLLATGVLAYQLGENFTCPSGISASEIQTNLDEYVNDRVAFPNDNQKAYIEEQIKAGLQGEMIDASVIHVYVNLSIEDASYEINLKNLDTRFGSSVYLHLSGESDSDCIVNIMNCQKLRIGIEMNGLPTINVYDCCLYYDADVIDKLSTISGLSLWYRRYNSDDPKLVVSGMTVEYYGKPDKVCTADYWDLDSPNDNHYSYALKGLTFGEDGSIVGAKMLVTDDITGNIEEGTSFSSFEFEFPQSLGLSYPGSKINKSIKISGHFITAYPTHDENNTYLMKENTFTALTYGNTNSSLIADKLAYTEIKGVISFKTTISHVDKIYGFGSGENGYSAGVQLDGWEPKAYHIFEGGTID